MDAAPCEANTDEETALFGNGERLLSEAEVPQFTAPPETMQLHATRVDDSGTMHVPNVGGTLQLPQLA